MQCSTTWRPIPALRYPASTTTSSMTIFLPEDSEVVVYRAFEMVDLVGQPERLRQLHLTKKKLDAVAVRASVMAEGGEAVA